MTLSQEDLSTIVSAVIAALLTNGKTIEQLTTVTEISEDDYFELNDGRKVSFETLRDLILSASGAGETTEVVDYDGRDEMVTFDYKSSTGVITIKQKSRQSKTVTIPTASSAIRGLMSAGDKVALTNALEDISALQEAGQNYVSTQAVLDMLEFYCPLGTGTKARIYPIYSAFCNLESMGEDLDTIDGGSYSYSPAALSTWYDPSTKKICFKPDAHPTNYDTYNPSSDVVYFNAATGRLYRWRNNNMEDLVVIKAPNGRLASSQAVPQVLASMGSTLNNVGNTGAAIAYSPNVGDTFFNNGYIYYQKSFVESINLGAPDTLVLYCNAKTNRLYRWNGSSMIEVG